MSDAERSAAEAAARLNTALGDRYDIQRELGAGGMATVYLAEDLKHDRQVAIKVLRPELAAVIGADRFLSEIKTTANLQHPHILPLFDSGKVMGRWSMADGEDPSTIDHQPSTHVFYVMPFIDGESLRDRLDRETQLPIADAVRITTEVASALDYAHRHGVIHRDIKPENILLHDGRALVADFGIALAASKSEGGTRMTETGMSLGTPHYMSPEQAMGERNLDARTDIYALGCVCYEMLTGDPPFDGSSAQAIVAKVMTEKPAPPSRVRDTIPEEVEDAVLTALAEAAGRSLRHRRRVRGGTGGKRHRDAPDHRCPARGPHRPPRPAGARASSRPCWRWSRSWAGPARELAGAGGGDPLAYQIHLTPSESDVGFVANQLAVSADGKLIVYSDTVGGTRQLWLKERGDAEARPIPGTQGGSGPGISPDGRSVAFTVGHQLRRIPLAGGASRLLSDSAVLGPVSIRSAWLENGTIVFLGSSSSILYTVPDTGGVARRLATADQLLGWAASVAPVPGQRRRRRLGLRHRRLCHPGHLPGRARLAHQAPDHPRLGWRVATARQSHPQPPPRWHPLPGRLRSRLRDGRRGHARRPRHRGDGARPGSEHRHRRGDGHGRRWWRDLHQQDATRGGRVRWEHPRGRFRLDRRLRQQQPNRNLPGWTPPAPLPGRG